MRGGCWGTWVRPPHLNCRSGFYNPADVLQYFTCDQNDSVTHFNLCSVPSVAPNQALAKKKVGGLIAMVAEGGKKLLFKSREKGCHAVE